jgi:hypothetical protein
LVNQYNSNRHSTHKSAVKSQRRSLENVVKYLTRLWPLLLLLALAAALFVATRPPAGNPAIRFAQPYADDPLLRAQACSAASLPQLIVLASDTDWRVRAAAYAALDRLAPLPKQPMRDTPLEQREQILLSWLADHQPPLVADLCELFARSSHAEFGDELAAQCLRCHVGREPAAPLESDRCTPCHETIHRQWQSSAHAQSLSHLRLPSIDPLTRAPSLYDFGPRRGLSCIACHEPTGPHDACLATFTTQSCATCHADAQTQWLQWNRGPRPTAAAWPPGSIQFISEGTPPSCIDCHMKDGKHLWPARRDSDLLRRGIDIRVRQSEEGPWQLILTNLSGHDYPTGSQRRAVELYVTMGDQPQQLLATLSPQRIDHDPELIQPALRPGEQRAINLPTTSANTIAYRLLYLRDRFSDDGYTAEIMAGERALR